MQRPGQMQFTDHPGNQMPRPDISMARGAMFNDGGVDINSQYGNPNQQQQVRPPQPRQQPFEQPSQKRPEMRGPQTDIDNILAGLKTKSVEMPFVPPSDPVNEIYTNADDSRISISSLKDMQNATAPKTSRRKNKSDKNTISLDI